MMRKIFLLALIFFGNAVFTLEQERVFLLTFPRSGTMWMLECLEDLSRYHQEQFLIIHDHYSPNFQTYGLDKNQDRLILLVRNYKECFIRHKGNWEDAKSCTFRPMPRKPSSNPLHYLSDYFENFYYFRAWNKEKTLLIYYEDLMTDFEREMTKISRFLEVDESWLIAFMKDYERHRIESIQNYEDEKKLGTSESKGNDILFHSRSLDRGVLLEMERFAANSYPWLEYTYLMRYRAN